MENLKNEIFTLLKESGAEKMGVADLSDLPESPYPVGICFMIPVPKHIIRDLLEAPTEEYYQMYHDYNKRLNEMGKTVEALLQEASYNAMANTTDKVVWNKEDHTTALPHKTVATKAGLGWIGKSCILVTKEFGGAFRMGVVLTDAPPACRCAHHRKPMWQLQEMCGCLPCPVSEKHPLEGRNAP